MKKLSIIILSLALLFAASVTAFAGDTITSQGQSASAQVKGTYVQGGSSAIVYSVDITWGSMDFIYTDTAGGIWNPQTHNYDGGTQAGWNYSEGANRITVTNHSNAAVTVSLQYIPDSNYSNITASFSQPTLSLATAENTAFSQAPSGSSELTLAGELSSSTTTKTNIGVVTVTLGNS